MDKKKTDHSTEDSSSDNSSSDSRFSHRSADELVLNAMLRDYLKKNLPPEFESRVLSNLQTRRAMNSMLVNKRSFSDDELDAALGAAQADIEFGQKSSASRDPNRVAEKPIKRLDPRWWDYKHVRTAVACVALAASLCIAYLFLPEQLKLPWNTNTPNAGDSLAESSLDGTSTEIALEKPSTPEVDSPIVPSVEDAVAVVEPSTTVPKEIEDQVREKTSVEPALEPRMSKLEIANVIDSQIDHIWSKFNIKGKEDSSVDLWMARVTQSAIGRQPTAAEKESFRLDKSENPRADYVERLVSSEEFSIHWGSLLAEHYLGVSVPMKRNRASDLLRFVDWIQESIQQKQSLVDVEAALVSTDTKLTDPASYWVAEQLKTGVMVESNIVSSSKVKLQFAQRGDIPIVNVASTLLHRMGNPQATCTQCHLGDSENVASFFPTGERISGSFWSFPAAVAKLVEKRKVTPDAPSRSNKSRDFFYEDMDGKLVMAPSNVTVSIDGKERTVDKLEEWIRLSSRARSGVAEFVWTQIVQQPLVPVFGLADSEANSERSDLKELLSKQLHASGSLQDLVASVLLSKAMGVAEAKLTTQWYVNAPAELLSNYHRSARLFAFAPANREPASGNSRRSISQIAGWLQTKGSLTAPTLAQPGLVKPQNTTKKKPEIDEVDKLLFLMSVDAPYENLDRFASVISKSSLPWDDQINHTYLMTAGRYPTAIERAEANRLLESAGNDAKKAIVLLSTNKLGSF